MKKLYLLAIMLLAAVGAYAQEGRNIYNRYSDTEGVSAVYISPSMFKLIGRIPELNVNMKEEKIDLAPLIRTFSGFYMLDVSNASVGKELFKEVTSMINKGRYEILMEVKNDGNAVRVYTAGNDKVIESIVFIAAEGDMTHFICLDGAMNRSDVESLLAKAAAASM